jgi:hypothetical protein
MASKTVQNLKTNNRDFDNILDSYLNLKDGGTVVGALTSTYLDFVSGHQGRLTETPVAITDGEADSAAATPNAANILAATLAAGAVNTYASDGGAAGQMFLPEATAGTHLAVEITGDIDGSTGTHTINTSGSANVTTSNVFAKQVIACQQGGHTAVAQAVETGGTYAAPTSKRLIYTPAAADTNCIGVGTMIHFYAPVTGEWLVKINNIKETTGATGALTVGT